MRIEGWVKVREGGKQIHWKTTNERTFNPTNVMINLDVDGLWHGLVVHGEGHFRMRFKTKAEAKKWAMDYMKQHPAD